MTNQLIDKRVDSIHKDFGLNHHGPDSRELSSGRHFIVFDESLQSIEIAGGDVVGGLRAHMQREVREAHLLVNDNF